MIQNLWTLWNFYTNISLYKFELKELVIIVEFVWKIKASVVWNFSDLYWDLYGICIVLKTIL